MDKTGATEASIATDSTPLEEHIAKKTKKPAAKMPDGLTEGGKLYRIDPRKAVIAGHDPDRTVAVTDPVFDERASLTDEQLNIDALATSLDASNEDVLVEGVVRDGEVWILAGRRRTRASRKVWAKREKAGKETPNYFVVIRSGNADKLAAAAFVENFGRVDDPPILLANKIKRHMDSRGWDIKFIAALMSATTQTVKNTLSLLKLCPELQNAVESDAISTSVGYELARLSHEKQLIALHELQEAAKKNAGKIRKIDATVAVARAKGVDPEDLTDEDEDPADSSISDEDGGGKKKKKAKKSETESKGPNYEPISASAIRRLLRAIDNGEITDTDKLNSIKKCDSWVLLQVIAGVKHINQVPGLAACLNWAGVKRA